MRKLAVLTGLASLLLPWIALAQEAPGLVGRVTTWTPKRGMERQFEDGVKKHNDFHKKQKDTWTIGVWEILAGPNTGRYYRGSFEHQWSDFDAEEKMGPADDADSAVNVNPFLEAGTTSFYVRLKDVSREPEDDKPALLSSLVWFDVRIGETDEFMELLRRFHEAIGKTKWPVQYGWYQLVSGGEIPSYVLVLPRKSWADFKPASKPFDEMLQEAFGKQEAKMLLDRLVKTLRAERSEILRFREDLSYIPAGK